MMNFLSIKMKKVVFIIGLLLFNSCNSQKGEKENGTKKEVVVSENFNGEKLDKIKSF